MLALVDELLEKLRPLIHREVASGRASLPFVDPDSRKLLELHIHARARELLGDWGAKVLLPPPPKAKGTGGLRLGEVVYPGLPGTPFGLEIGGLLQHVGIYGRSGAGKTTAVFALLRQLTNNRVPFLALDWKRSYRDLIPQLRASVRVYTPGRSVAPGASGWRPLQCAFERCCVFVRPP